MCAPTVAVAGEGAVVIEQGEERMGAVQDQPPFS